MWEPGLSWRSFEENTETPRWPQKPLSGHAICIKSQVGQMLENIALNIRTKSALHRILPPSEWVLWFVLAIEIFLCPAGAVKWGTPLSQAVVNHVEPLMSQTLCLAVRTRPSSTHPPGWNLLLENGAILLTWHFPALLLLPPEQQDSYWCCLAIYFLLDTI